VKIAFFGLPLAALLLHADGHAIELAVLSPIDAPGRRRLRRTLGDASVVDALAHQKRLDARVDNMLSARDFDVLVSWFWTRKLPLRWLQKGRHRPMGVHPSLLPRHRGPNPFFWAIDSGDERTGVSVHVLEAEYDTGDVLARRELTVGERNAWQLARALDRPSLSLLRDVVARLARGETLVAEPQDEAQASWAREPDAELLRVDFGWTTERVLRRVRALSPVPGLALELEGQSFFVTGAERATHYPTALAAGEAAAVGSARDELVIRTGDGAIRVKSAVAGVSGGLPEGTSLPVSALAELVATRNRAV